MDNEYQFVYSDKYRGFNVNYSLCFEKVVYVR